MTIKYRSSLNFAETYASEKQGVGISIENFVHIKEETTPGTFVPPSIGTQGSSTSGSSPSTDISGGSNTNLKAAVDGFAAVNVTLALPSMDTGPEIAAELETKINAALVTAGYDARVWAEFASSVYKIWSQKVGTASTVVITDGATLDVATALKLGVTGNGGSEAAGTFGGDFLYMTKCSLKVSQPFKPSMHKTGRQPTNIIKEKIKSEGDLELYFNLGSGVTPTLDTPVALLLEAIMGRKTTTGSSIVFDSYYSQDKYFSIVQSNNMFSRSFSGGYPKSLTIALPGDGEAKLTMPIKARNGLYASIAKLSAAVSDTEVVIVEAGESNRFEVGARVMVVDDDGRTIVGGATGAITVLSRTDVSNIVTLSEHVTVDDDGYLVFWAPHVLDVSGTDNPTTTLTGTVSFDGGTTPVEEIRNVEITFDPKFEDQDAYYGADSNRGRVVSDRSDIKAAIDLVMSASQISKVINAKEFESVNINVVLGAAAGRRVEFDLPKMYIEVPDMELPETGTVVAKLSGFAMQSAAGMMDALTISYL